MHKRVVPRGDWFCHVCRPPTEKKKREREDTKGEFLSFAQKIDHGLFNLAEGTTPVGIQIHEQRNSPLESPRREGLAPPQVPDEEDCQAERSGIDSYKPFLESLEKRRASRSKLEERGSLPSANKHILLVKQREIREIIF